MMEMKKSRFSEEQIIRFLKQGQASRRCTASAMPPCANVGDMLRPMPQRDDVPGQRRRQLCVDDKPHQAAFRTG